MSGRNWPEWGRSYQTGFGSQWLFDPRIPRMYACGVVNLARDLCGPPTGMSPWATGELQVALEKCGLHVKRLRTIVDVLTWVGVQPFVLGP